MLNQDIYISGYAAVKSHSLFKNGELVFSFNQPGEKDFLISAFEALKINYPKFYKMDALGKLGIITTDVLLQGLPADQYPAPATGIVLSNRNASIEADLNYYKSVSEIPSPALFVYTLPNIVIGELSIRYKFKGENAFFVSEQFDADWLHFYINNLLQQQNLDACLGGWIDVIDNRFDAFIFYVEKVKREGSLNFTAQNLEYLYQQ